MKFKIGDVVRLKHSSNKMTVYAVSTAAGTIVVSTMWFTTLRQIAYATFSPEVLAKAE